VTASDAGRLSGAIISILDGANAGRSVTSNSSGEYRFENLTQGNANVSASANGYFEARGGLFVNGTNTLNFTLQPSGPKTTFGPGSHRVGTDIAAGRYYSDPTSGCYWERQRGSNVVGNDAAASDLGQIIVDILADDTTFVANAQCGTWTPTPRGGVQSTIRGGTWLVNQQVTPGMYEALSARHDCYWERLRGFQGDTGDIIESGLSAADGTVTITIGSGDLGFKTLEQCGPWTRVNTSSTSRRPAASSPGDILRNREMSRSRLPLGRR
jgi:hypothetical protein